MNSHIQLRHKLWALIASQPTEAERTEAEKLAKEADGSIEMIKIPPGLAEKVGIQGVVDWAIGPLTDYVKSRGLM